MTASTQATNEPRLPRAVLRKSAQIEEHLAAQRAEHARLSEQPPVAAPVAPQAAADSPAPPGNPQAVASPAEDPRENDPKYWKHRFLTVDGVLRRQVETHNNQVAAANRRITELQEQVRTLQAAAPAPVPDIAKHFSPEEIEKYGPEQCAVMLRGSDTIARERVAKAVEERIKPLEEEAKAKAEHEKVAEWQRFLDRLNDAHPGFIEMDKTPGWQAWLAETDPATDAPRQKVLDVHVGSRNVAAIARMAKVYEQASRPAPPPQPLVAPHGTAASGGMEAPAPSPAAQAGAPTDTEVRDFFKRAAIGRVTPDERTKFEARMKLRVPAR